MKMIKAVLLDDEPAGLKTLELLLKKHCPEISVEATFLNPETALKAIATLQPDLLFLDIEMPGMSGFDFMLKAKQFKGKVIFVTAHSSYAVRAFKFSALDYLLKPVDVGELQQAVSRYQTLEAQPPEPAVLDQLIKNIGFLSQPAPQKIAIPTSDGIEVLLLKDIAYLKADRNYTLIKRTDKKDLLVAKTLKEFEDLLQHTQFMRPHSSYIINMDKVARYVKADGGYAQMDDGTPISVSRNKKEEFLGRLKSSV